MNSFQKSKINGAYITLRIYALKGLPGCRQIRIPIHK